MPPLYEELKEDYTATNGELKVGDTKINLIDLLQVINGRIEILLDRDHLIGHSYFLDVKNEAGLKNAFSKQIIPLLQEYFYGDYGKISLVLGEGFCKGIKQTQITSKFAKAKNYDVDAYSDTVVYTINNSLEKGQFEEAIKVLLNEPKPEDKVD
jgi:5-methylcytosine-specific restriction protein B